MTERDLNISLRKKETNEILNIYPLTKSENVYLSDEDTLKTYLKNQDSLNSIFVNDSKKLKKIEDGAQRNQNAISIINHNDQIYESDKENGSVELISGDNVSIEIVGSKIKFSVKERTIQKASANRDGLMSKEDYTKLFNIEDVTEKAFNKQDEIQNKLTEIEEYMKQEIEPKQDIDKNCFKPYKCEFWEYCTR